MVQQEVNVTAIGENVTSTKTVIEAPLGINVRLWFFNASDTRFGQANRILSLIISWTAYASMAILIQFMATGPVRLR